MELGTCSLSLAVKDLQASRAFYEKLGFTSVGSVSFVVVDPDGNPVLFDRHR